MTNDRPSEVVSGSGTTGHSEDYEDEELGSDSGPDSVSVSDGVGAPESVLEVQPSEPPSAELQELAMKWGAEIGLSGALIGNKITMSRKEYLKYTKTITQEQVLADPLLHILFRSEEQGDPNFFTWLERFPKGDK